MCIEKSDYQKIIAKLEGQIKGESYKSYYQSLLADLYNQIGDTDAVQKTLESNLQYGADYWRLAEHWLNQGEYEKAVTIVTEGIEKGEGRKNELYAFMQ